MDETLPEDRAAVASILGRIPSGVFIFVASDGQNQTTGMMASWVQQASFEPPQITVAVNRTRYLNAWLQPNSPVTLNQVARGDVLLFRHFGKGFEPGEDAFDSIPTTPGRNGLPVLPDAMASLEGKISGMMEAGDHLVYLVTVTHASSTQDSASFEPFVHIRKNGFSY